jgi:hypothetical protein
MPVGDFDGEDAGLAIRLADVGADFLASGGRADLIVFPLELIGTGEQPAGVNGTAR